jgi:Arc/MetJ-type ribon-helix-helix transcriptional regulator
LTVNYTPIAIPESLHKRIERVISRNGGFTSVSEYVAYVLREGVSKQEAEETLEPFTFDESEQIKDRLKVLGYL